MTSLEEIAALAKLLSECPFVYTVDNYGAIGPGEESVEAYGAPGGVAEWLWERGVRVGAPPEPKEKP